MPKTTDKISRYREQTEAYKHTILLEMANREMSQADLAKVLGVSPSSVSRKLKDIDRITFGDMRMLASRLGLEITIGEKGGRK